MVSKVEGGTIRFYDLRSKLKLGLLFRDVKRTFS